MTTTPAPVPGSETSSACGDCDDTGWVEAEDGDGVERCHCFRAAEDERRVQKARIPARYRHVSLDNFDQLNSSLEAARLRCEKYVEGFEEVDYGLIFVGPAGVGKTHLGVAVLRALMERHGVDGLFVDYRNLLREIQSTYNPVSETSELDVLRPVLSADVLLLDELGSRRPSDWVMNTVTQLLNDRYSACRITLITTNYPDPPGERRDGSARGSGATRERSADEESLAERIGAYARSRLYQMCKVVPMAGEDYRKNAQNVDFDRRG